MTNSGNLVHSGISLGMKATLAAIGLIVVISSIFTALFIVHQKNVYLEELRKRVSSLSSNLAFNSRFALYSQDIQRLESLVAGVDRESDILSATITDTSGYVIVSTAKSIGDQMGLVPASIDTSGLWWSVPGHKIGYRMAEIIAIDRQQARDDESFMLSPLQRDEGDQGRESVNEILGYAVLDVSDAGVNDALSQVVSRAILITLGMMLLAIVTVVLVVRRIVKPIYLLAEATGEVAKGRFGKVVNVNRKDELGLLSESFNDMSVQLAQSRRDLDKLNNELSERVTESTAELMSQYNELETTMKELKVIDAAKDDFISLVSHELRTPLSSIQMFSESLLHGVGKTEKKYADILQTIIRNCKRLSRLINDVLDLSKIEAGHIKFNLIHKDIIEVIEDTVISLTPSLELGKIRLERSYPDSPVIITLDPDRITQVATNILSNAIKFSPEGGTIIITLVQSAELVSVTVQDEGVGIAEEDISKVFNKFYQLENIKLTAEGSGLGMSIAKLIVENLGGQILIDSEQGVGTKVTFTLPASN